MAPELQQLVFLLLSTVITVAVPVLTVKLIAYIEQKAGEVGAKLTADQIATLKTLSTYVIQSVQQSKTDDLLKRTGEEKKSLAISKLQALADEFGLPNVSIETLSDLIESGINQGLHKDKAPTFEAISIDQLAPLKNYELSTAQPIVTPRTAEIHGG